MAGVDGQIGGQKTTLKTTQNILDAMKDNSNIIGLINVMELGRKRLMNNFYYLSMPESFNDKQSSADKTASSEQVAAAPSQAPSSARIKRMRGWLGVKSSSSLGGYDDGGGGVVYGDGHSGWNR